MSTSKKRKSVLLQLVQRRVPQIFGVYLGMSWVIIEFIGWVTQRYVLSPNLPDFSLIILLCFIPSVLIVAYYHGRPGRDDWTRVEKFAIPINVLATILLLAIINIDNELDAATQVKNVTDEFGESKTKIVAKPEFRRTAVIFNFRDLEQRQPRSKLSLIIPYALNTDLSQDIFLKTKLPINEQIYAQLQRADFKLTDDVPLTLMHKLAQSSYSNFFVTGEIQNLDSTYSIKVKIYSTKNSELLFEHTEKNKNFFSAIDDISSFIRQSISRPNASQLDLPVAELLSNDLAAVQAVVQAKIFQLENSYHNALLQIDEALKIDPKFAAALAFKGELELATNDTAAARRAFSEALKLSYKFSEESLFEVKTGYYLATGDFDKWSKLIDMQLELYPQSIELREHRAHKWANTQKVDRALKEYQEILQHSDQPHSYYLKVASLYMQAQEHEKAQKYITDYNQTFPNRIEGYFLLAKLHNALLEHTKQKLAYEKVLLLEPQNVLARLLLIRLALNVGDYQGIPERIERILEEDILAKERVLSYEILQEYYLHMGQPNAAIHALEKKLQTLKDIHTPVNYSLNYLFSLDLYVQAGQTEKAESLAKTLSDKIESPFNRLTPLGELIIKIEKKDGEGAWLNLQELETTLQDMGGIIFGLQPKMNFIRGSIQALRGNTQEAIDLLEIAVNEVPEPFKALILLGRLHTRLENFDKAENYFRQCEKINPNEPFLNLELAKFNYQQGKTSEAIRRINMALNTWKNAEDDFNPANEARSMLVEWQEKEPALK